MLIQPARVMAITNISTKFSVSESSNSWINFKLTSAYSSSWSGVGNDFSVQGVAADDLNSLPGDAIFFKIMKTYHFKNKVRVWGKVIPQWSIIASDLFRATRFFDEFHFHDLLILTWENNSSAFFAKLLNESSQKYVVQGFLKYSYQRVA